VKREAEGSAGPEAMVGLAWDELARRARAHQRRHARRRRSGDHGRHGSVPGAVAERGGVPRSGPGEAAHVRRCPRRALAPLADDHPRGVPVPHGAVPAAGDHGGRVTDAGVGQGVHAVGEGRWALAHAERAASAAARPRQGAMCRGDLAAQARGRGGEGGRLIRSVRPQHLTIPPCQHDLAVRPLRWPGGHRRRRENRCRGTSQGCRVSVPIFCGLI
jgi:hypothetical protein